MLGSRQPLEFLAYFGPPWRSGIVCIALELSSSLCCLPPRPRRRGLVACTRLLPTPPSRAHGAMSEAPRAVDSTLPFAPSWAMPRACPSLDDAADDRTPIYRASTARPSTSQIRALGPNCALLLECHALAAASVSRRILTAGGPVA